MVEEEKKENYEKEMEVKIRDEEDMQDSLVVKEGRTVKIPLVPLPLISFPCIFFCNVLSSKKKVNNHTVELHPASQHHANSARKLYPVHLCALPIIKHLQKLWKCLLERRKPPEAPDHLPLAALPYLSAQ